MGVILGEQEKTADAIRVFEEMVRRFEGSEVLVILKQVAVALFNKAVALIRLNREEDALGIYSEIADRFGTTGHSELRSIAGDALLNLGELELKLERNDAARETATRALELSDLNLPEIQVKGYLIRAMATMSDSDRSACERDLSAVLNLLPETRSLPRGSLDALVVFSAALGPEHMCKLIKASPSAGLLLPLTTALELELGIEPRVAQEVREVAEDIRGDLAKLRQTGTGGSGEEALDSAPPANSELDDV